MSPEISNNDLLILLMKYSKPPGIMGRTRFQKAVFVAEVLEEIPFKYEFVPWLYGPYSKSLQESLDVLIGMDIFSQDVDTSSNRSYSHTITEKGEKLAQKIASEYPQIDKRLREFLKQIDGYSTEVLIILAKYLLKKQLSCPD